MFDDLSFVSDEEWEQFGAEMEKLASYGTNYPNVPAGPADIKQSAFASFFRRRRLGEKREMSATTPEAVRLVLLFRTWRKIKEHRRRGTYVVNRTIRTSEISEEGSYEASLPDTRAMDEEIRDFIDAMEESLATLSKEHRSVVELCLQGFSTKEIADSLNVTTTDVRGMLANLRVTMTDAQ